MVHWLLPHLQRNFIVLLLLTCIDHFGLKPVLAPRFKKNEKDLKNVRWFLIHAIANAFVCATAFRAVYVMLTDPINAMDADKYSDTSMFGAASVWPLTFVNSVHIYHMVGGFSLTGSDYFHHLLFIPALGLPGQLLPWGSTEPGGAFFISGLPGGISYSLLGLQKLGVGAPISEKRCTANLNTWVRTPGIMYTSILVYQAWLYGKHSAALPMWAALLHVFLPPYNALYYQKQAVANYAVHYMTNLLGQDETMSQRISELAAKASSLRVPTDTWSSTKNRCLVSWKEALSVPQRGC